LIQTRPLSKSPKHPTQRGPHLKLQKSNKNKALDENPKNWIQMGPCLGNIQIFGIYKLSKVGGSSYLNSLSS